MTKIPRTESLVVEYLLNEADSGQDVVDIADNLGGNANPLTMFWGRGNGSWIDTPSGRGINFADPVRNSSSNILYQDGNIVDTGNIGARFGSSVQKACIHLVANIRVGHTSVMRLVSIASLTGNTVVSIHANAASIEGRWNSEIDSNLVRYENTDNGPGAGHHAFSMYVDTTQTIAADRIKLYVDGARVSFTLVASADSIDQDETCDFNQDRFFFTIGNRGSQDRNPEADIHYVALRNDTDDEANVAEIHAALLANNDESPFEPGEPPTGEDGNALGTISKVSVTAIRGFATIAGQGHGEGSLANTSVSPIAGYAEHFGDGVAVGAIADIAITPVAGSAISIKAANASGDLADVSIIPIAGFADISDRGRASGSIADIDITPIDGNALAVMHGIGVGTLSVITITPINGYATIDGSAVASGGLANIVITPINGRASVPSDDGRAIGLLADVTITPVDGSAISIKDANASGSLVDISITPILGFADIGQRGQASGSLADVQITPIAGLATATIEGKAIGLLANVAVSPIKGFAVGEGDDHGAGSIHDILVTPVDGFATAGVQEVPTIRLRVELSETIELTTELNTIIYNEVTP